MAKITKLEEKTFQNKHSGWRVSIDNGPLENMDEKASDDGLREGDDVVVTVTDYVAKSTGKHSNLLTVKREQGTTTPAFKPSGGQTPSLINNNSLKFEARMKCMQLAHDAYLAGKLDDKEAQNHCREWVVMSDALIDDLGR